MTADPYKFSNGLPQQTVPVHCLHLTGRNLSIHIVVLRMR